MRRFSQRSGLVTLSEINITPLLDLAFVLLIIFVITTPLLEQSLLLKLYHGGAPMQKVDPRNIRTVEIGANGVYKLDKMRMTQDQVTATLGRDFQSNPNLAVAICADENGRIRDAYAVLDYCRKSGIKSVDLRTQPLKRQ